MHLELNVWNGQGSYSMDCTYINNELRSQVTGRESKQRLIGVDAFWSFIEKIFPDNASPMQAVGSASIPLERSQILIDAIRKNDTYILSNLNSADQNVRAFLFPIAQTVESGVIIRCGGDSEHFIKGENANWEAVRFAPGGGDLKFEFTSMQAIKQRIVRYLVFLVENSIGNFCAKAA